MDRKFSDSLPVRQLVFGLAALGLGWIGMNQWSDISQTTSFSPVEKWQQDQHEHWMFVQYCFIFSGIAMLLALFREKGSDNGSSSTFSGIIRGTIERLRGWLFKLASLFLEVVLVSAIFTCISFSIKDGTPPMHMERGVMMDWLMELMVLTLLIMGALFNLGNLSEQFLGS